MGLEQLFYSNVETLSEKTAIVCMERSINYAELASDTAAYCDFLRQNTLPGTQILILAHNSIEQIELILACFSTGRVACPLNWRMSYQELGGILQEQKFDYAVFDSACSKLLADAVKFADIELRTIDIALLPKQGSGLNFSYETGETCPAILYYTSGSTGKPKAVLHTHRSMMRYVAEYTKASDWTSSDVYMTQSNLFHVSGFSCLTSIFIGGTLVLMSQFREEEFFPVMEREHCTRLSLVPTLISKCLNTGAFQKYDFSSVKKIIYGGSALHLSHIKRTMQECTCSLEQAYGSTETCNISILSDEDHIGTVNGTLPPVILESVGKPISGVEVKIINDNETIENGEGEIAVRSDFLVDQASYSRPGSFTSDGFYRTGDIGRIDENGYIYIIDRKNDMIISGGENIYPREVENCISRLISDVAMTVVIGVPDEYWGENVVAFVVRRPGSNITETDIIEYCRKCIASYKKPKRVIFLDSIPLNSNGKINRHMMKEIYQHKYCN